LTAVITQLCH